MSDLIDVLDEQGLRTGEILSRREIHRLGKIHRAIHLYLFDASGRLLLQRRSQTVDHYPGALTISVLGHIDAGQSSMETVEREIKEELGLDPSPLSIRFLFSYRRDTQIGPEYIDCQFNDIYAGWGDFGLSDLSFDTGEVSDVEFIDLDEFSSILQKKDTLLSDLYRNEYKDVSYFLRSYFSRDRSI